MPSVVYAFNGTSGTQTCDRLSNFRRIGKWHASEHLARSRIDYVLPLGGLGLLPFAPDEIRNIRQV